jgi:hypothetical protein
MDKNINKNLKQLRISKGFKTRDSFMASIEKYCKENDYKVIGDKTIQRMENDHFASEKTIEIVASVLKVSPSLIKDDGSKSKSIDIEDINYSEIYLNPIFKLTSDFKDNFKKSDSRKFIFDIGQDQNDGQIEGIKKFIQEIDNYAQSKLNVLDQIKGDQFGENSINIREIENTQTLEWIIKHLRQGVSWKFIEEENSYMPMINQKNSKPIYIFHGLHPFATYWPFPKSFYDIKIKHSPGAAFSKFFPNKSVSNGQEFIYNPKVENDFVLAPVSFHYSFFVFSSNPNLKKLTYENKVSKIVMEEWLRVSKKGTYENIKENKIIGKKYFGLFDVILDDIVNNVDGLPKNILEDSDFNKIYEAKNNADWLDPWQYQSKLKEEAKELIDLTFKSSNLTKNLINCEFGLCVKDFKAKDNKNEKTRLQWFESKKLLYDLEEFLTNCLHVKSKDKVFEIIKKGGKDLEELCKSAHVDDSFF